MQCCKKKNNLRTKAVVKEVCRQSLIFICKKRLDVHLVVVLLSISSWLDIKPLWVTSIREKGLSLAWYVILSHENIFSHQAHLLPKFPDERLQLRIPCRGCFAEIPRAQPRLAVAPMPRSQDLSAVHKMPMSRLLSCGVFICVFPWHALMSSPDFVVTLKCSLMQFIPAHGPSIKRQGTACNHVWPVSH